MEEKSSVDEEVFNPSSPKEKKLLKPIVYQPMTVSKSLAHKVKSMKNRIKELAQ